MKANPLQGTRTRTTTPTADTTQRVEHRPTWTKVSRLLQHGGFGHGLHQCAADALTSQADVWQSPGAMQNVGMPLYEISADGLIPFRQLRGGAELYEAEIEHLLWDNLDDLTGQVLFRVRRQAPISGGGRPDIVALDRSGSVVVIEVKRELDRSQLAQCLEYAGWARTTNLDELAGLYHEGAERFWSQWQEFTDTDEPRRVTRNPQLVLVARDFHGRTDSALEFLQDNGLPITIIQLALYEDSKGRRFLDLEGLDEPETPHEGGKSSDAVGPRARVSYHVTTADLIGAGLLQPGEELLWERPRARQSLACRVTDDGRLALPDGRVFSSPSGAADAAAGGGSFDGWECWRAPLRNNKVLLSLRQEYLRNELESRSADIDK